MDLPAHSGPLVVELGPPPAVKRVAQQRRLRAFLSAVRAREPGARALGEALLRRFPDMQQVPAPLARLRLEAGDHAGALALALQVLTRIPGEPTLLGIAAEAAEALGEAGAAAALRQDIAGPGRRSVWTAFQEERRVFASGDAAQPGFREKKLRAFLAACKAGDPRALALGEALLRRFPDLPRLRGTLARLKLDAGHPQAALTLARQELAHLPEDPDLLRIAASASAALGEQRLEAGRGA